MPTIVNQLGISTTDQVIYTQANQPVVEPLGGNVSLTDIMKRFPEEVYHSGPDTRLYKFIQALCGDSGAGILKAQSLAIRLKNEGPLLVFHDLDTLYSHILNFPRITRELYNYDQASNTLLDINYDPTNVSVEKEVWDKIHAADDSYRRRVLDFMSATRSGNSPRGMELAAKAGSGEECDIVENYHWCFDQYSDDPLSLDHVGDTVGTGEFVIMPAGTANVLDNVAANVVTLTFLNGPTTSTFTLSYEGVSTTPITYDGTNIATSIRLAMLAIAGGLFTTTSFTVVVDPASIDIYKITFLDPQLDVLFLGIDPSALISGTATLTYPLGLGYYMTQFAYPLADFYEDNYSEIVSGHLETDYALPGNAFYTGNVRNQPTVHLTPEIEYNMIRTVDHLRPVGTVMTVKPKRASSIQVQAIDAFASSENFNLVRWVTGNPSVAWPPLDAESGAFIQGVATSNGITKNVENESTTFAFGTHIFPALFQTINTVQGYTDGALLDATYNTANFPTRYPLYKSEHIGHFDRLITLMFPFLDMIRETDRFGTDLVIPPNEPTPLIFSAPFVNS